MKSIIAASALALLALATPTFAVDKADAPIKTTASDSMGNYYTETDKTDFLASKLIGAKIYATKKPFDANAAYEKPADDWDHIGEVNNLIIGRDGMVKAVVLGVGGFLSIGEKDVAVKMSELKFLQKTADKSDDFYIVVDSDKAALEKAPTWKRSSN